MLAIKESDVSQNITWADTQTENWLKRHFSPVADDPHGAAADVASTINSQYSAQTDYAARVLLELLQNVDDAAAEGNVALGDNSINTTAEFILDKDRLIVLNQGKVFNETALRAICLGHISPKAHNNKNITTGSKGIGFRGVLNWSSDISIVSGDFAVQFSKEQCSKHIAKLKDNKIFQLALETTPDIVDKFPILLLPGNTKYPTEWQNGKYNGTYDTCMTIGINKDKIPLVIEAINNFVSKEYYSALFFRALTCIKFTIVHSDDAQTQITIRTHEEPINTPNVCKKTIDVFNNVTGNTALKQDFFMFSSGLETIAVPVDWASWEKKRYNVYCTFPANKEFCPFPVLMNSYDFDLPSNRESVQSNTKNANIIKKLENLLVDTVIPYFAKPEFGAQAIEILAYRQIEGTHFLKNTDDLYAKIATKPIIPTLSGKYKCLNDGLKTLKYHEYPAVLTNSEKDRFVSTEIHSALGFAAELQHLITPLSDTGLYEFINENSCNWTTKERISVFFFWVDQVGLSQQTMPKLIKNRQNEFYTFNSSEHEPIYFYSGKQIAGLPDWVPFDTVSKEDQNELFVQAKLQNPELTKEIDRYLSGKYERIFKYMDKTHMTQDINKHVDNIYERSVDLIKFIYLNYKDEEKPSSDADITWHIPTYDGRILPSKQVFFDTNYQDTIGAKICRAAKLTAFAAPETFGIQEEEKERFCYIMGSFLGVRSTITQIKQKKTSSDQITSKYRDLIIETLKDKYNTDRIILYDIEEYDAIPELKDILDNADQATILEWLSALPLNRFNKVNVSFHKPYSGRRTDTINIIDHTVLQLMNYPWIDIHGRKVKPINCLLKQDKSKYPDELVNYVPDGKKHGDLWALLDIQDNVCHLPQEIFYDFLLKLPDFDPKGEISKQIYGYIARTNSESLSNLTNHSYCAEKNRFLVAGKVWVKDRKRHTAQFVPIAEEVYFSSKKVLNIDNKPIIDTPQRTGSLKDFAHIFGVKEFVENVQACPDTSVPHPQNEKFRTDFEHFKPYLLALNATQKLNDALPDLEIILAKYINILNNTDNQDIIFDNYEIIPTQSPNKYFIYLHENQQIKSSALARAIGEICNTISSSSDIRETVAYLYKSDDDDRKDILLDKGCNIELLSEYRNTRQLFIDTINRIRPDIDVNMLLSCNTIDFEDFSSHENHDPIIKIIEQLNSSVEEFEHNGFPYINLKERNKANLQHYIESNREIYKTWLYNELLDKNADEQGQFEARMRSYDQLADKADVPNTHDFNPALLRPIPNTTELIQYTGDIYKANLERLSVLCTNSDILTEILNSDTNVSLLTFGHINIIKEKYDTAIQAQKMQNIADATNQSADDMILEIHQHQYQEPDKEQSTTQAQSHPRNNGKRQHSAQSDASKQNAGLKAERKVYNRLKLEFPDTVEWVSSNAVKAGVLAKGQADDRLGYDIRYKDKSGNVKYAEVKNAGDLGDKTCSFIITPNEEKFANDHVRQYSIFLVVEDSRIEQISGEDLTKYLKSAVPESKKCVIPLINKSVDI